MLKEIKKISPSARIEPSPYLSTFQNSKRTHTVASLREGTMLQEIQARGDLES